MGVSDTTNRQVYNGDGSSTVFAFQHYFFNQSDLNVWTYDTILGGVTQQILNTNYTISGSPSASGVYPLGANVVINSSPAATAKVVIFRNPPDVQNFTLAQNGIIPSTPLTQQFDYLTLIAQRLSDLSSRAITLSDGDGSGAVMTLPSGMALNPNAAILINSSGLALTYGAVQLLGSSSSSVVGVVQTANGGTGTSLTPNPYAVIATDGNSKYTSTNTGGLGIPLVGQGSSSPIFAAVNLAGAGVTGILPEANGGTGVGGANYQQFGVVYASSATQLSTSASGGVNQVLTAQGSSAPVYSTLAGGALDSQTANNGGIQFSGVTAYLQSAGAAQVGIVNSSAQIFTGQKQFTQGLLTPQIYGSSVIMPTTFHPDGTLAAPSITFQNDLLTGFNRSGGAKHLTLGLSAVALMDSYMVNSSAINYAFGSATGTALGNPLSWNYTYNGTAAFNYSNLSQGTGAITQFYIGAGASGANGLTIENAAFANTAYTGGGGLVSASATLSFLNICCESTTGYMTLNVGGRTLATERMRITQSSAVHNNGVSMGLTGSSGNLLQFKAAATGSSAVLVWPTGQGGVQTFLENDGSGNLSWGTPSGVTFPGNYYASVYYTVSSSNYWTNANTTIGNFTAQGTIPTPGVLTSNGFGSVFGVAASSLPGLSCSSAPRTGTIKVTCTASITPGLNAAATLYSLFLLETVGSTTVATTSGAVTANATTAARFPITMVGYFNATSGSNFNLKLESAIGSGTLYLGGDAAPSNPYMLSFQMEYIN